MPLYFETSVSYDKMMENGTVKKTVDKFIFDALTFTEAESRTIEECAPFISGEFTVKTAKKTKIAEIFGLGENHEYWWLAKVAFIQLDEKTGAEKKTVTQILVGADNFHKALNRFEEGMKGTLADYELQSLSLTDILEVYPFKASEESPKPESVPAEASQAEASLSPGE